jgi:hypothetical protein
MINFFPNEKWKEVEFKNRIGLRYAISSFGRLVSFTESIKEGRMLKCGQVKGYKVFRSSEDVNGKRVSRGIFLHKLVAENFLSSQRRDDKTYVIHLDFVKDNNHQDNLQWATKEEMELHQSKNPKVIKDRKRLQEFNKIHTYKLSEAKVKILKRKLLDPNRKTRIKMLARQFGVSEMQLHRIRTGENWGHVKI